MPNIDLINALIDTYQPGNKGYMDVQLLQRALDDQPSAS